MNCWRSSRDVSLLSLALAGWGASAQAQVAPPQPPTREEVQRQPIGPDVRPPSRLTVEGGVERAPCPLADERFRDVTVTISEARFNNLRVVSPEILRPAYADFLGRSVPIAAVCEIRDAAATILRREGYLAAVQVPPQRIENGVVQFDVLMAKLVAVQVRGDAGRAETLIAGYLDRLKEQEVFNEKEAERYLLLARDLPGFDVRLTLRPAGTVPGEVIGEVAVVKTPFSIEANVQNYGSHSVGRWGGLLRGEAYDILGFGDRLVAGFYATPDFEEQKVVQLGYDMRLGSEGLTIGGRFTYAWTEPDLGDPTQVGGQIKSDTLVAAIEATYPFLRSQTRNVRGGVGLEWIDQKTTLAASAGTLPISKDKLRVLYGRLDFELIDRLSLASIQGYSVGEPMWRLAGSLELRQGLDIFGASDPCGPTACAGRLFSLSRLEGKPQSTLIRFSGIAEYRPVPLITFSLAPRAQYSSRSLLSYEQYSTGNYTVGRGYDPGALLGDSGVGFQAEFRYGSIAPRARDQFAIQPFVFYDNAWVWDTPFSLPGTDPEQLASYGGGVRVAYGDHARLEVIVAKPDDRVGLQTKKGDARLLVSLTTRLWPWVR